jgi:glycosylphosphatidylinositol deacylase
VNTIITQATPHQRPVVNLDKKMSDYYDRVNRYWLNKNHTGVDHVVLVSLYGGVRDVLVRSGLSNLNEWRNQSGAKIISTYTVSMPKVWRSSDHR